MSAATGCRASIMADRWRARPSGHLSRRTVDTDSALIETLHKSPARRRITQTIVESRPTGISAVGDLPWGTHLCHFYDTKGDLIDILLPFFQAGLEANEYCMW